MSVGKRIKQLREKQNLTGVQLAARAEIDQSYLSKLERGLTGYSEEGLKKLSAALGVPIATIFGSGNIKQVMLPQGRRIPILNYVQAGKLTAMTDTLEDDEIGGWVFVDDNTLGDGLFALIVRGESMLPEFSEGDIVIIRRSSSPQPGDYVVATRDGEEATFKRFRVLSNDKSGREVFALVPLNSDYPTLRSDETNLSITGYLVEHRKYRNRRSIPSQR